MSRFLKWVGAIALIVLVGALVVNSCQSSRRAKQAESATAAADSLRSHAEARLAEALAAGEKIKEVVKEIRKTDTLFLEKEKIVLGKPVPESCREYTEPIVDLLKDCKAQTEKWRGAYEDQSAVTSELLVVVDTLKASNDSLQKAVKLLIPRPFTIKIPLIGLRVKPAVFGGVCSSGKLCVGVGGAITF